VRIKCSSFHLEFDHLIQIVGSVDVVGADDASNCVTQLSIDKRCFHLFCDDSLANTQASSSKKLSGGAIAGIVIGVIVFVAIVVVGVILLVVFVIRRPSSGYNEATEVPMRRQVKVVKAFPAENWGELQLDVGDVVTVLKDEANGQLSGTNKGKTGVFPASCIEELNADWKAQRVNPTFSTQL